MKVNFRVVGVFCDLEDIYVGNFLVPPTIREVMGVIRANPDFNFTFVADDEVDPSVPGDKASLLSVAFERKSPFETYSKTSYPAGTYTLADGIDVKKQVAHVFQYYLMRRVPGTDGEQNISRGNKFVSFGNSEKVKEGDSIIWRQVSICLPGNRDQMESHPQFRRLRSLGIA
jgi:hypothetical protein